MQSNSLCCSKPFPSTKWGRFQWNWLSNVSIRYSRRYSVFSSSLPPPLFTGCCWKRFPKILQSVCSHSAGSLASVPGVVLGVVRQFRQYGNHGEVQERSCGTLHRDSGDIQGFLVHTLDSGWGAALWAGSPSGSICVAFNSVMAIMVCKKNQPICNLSQSHSTPSLTLTIFFNKIYEKPREKRKPNR